MKISEIGLFLILTNKTLYQIPSILHAYCIRMHKQALMPHVIVKALPRVLYEKYSTRGCVERLIQHEAKPSAVFASRHSPSAVFFIQHKHRWCFNCHIVLPGCLVWCGFVEYPNR